MVIEVQQEPFSSIEKTAAEKVIPNKVQCRSNTNIEKK